MSAVAIVGGGIIGSSWALVFARAGWHVRVYSRHESVRATVRERVRRAATLARAIAPAVAPDEIVERLTVAGSLEAALDGVAWVQESIEESAEAKQALFADLDRAAPPDAILASSTSSIAMSIIAGEVAGRARTIVAHPATPPHLIPVVEMVPAPFTDASVVERALATMRTVGQHPVLVRRERPGFVMNRLQGALLTEMFAVVRDGLMSPDDVDALIRDGFGLRWAWLGPLEGVDLNAPGGIADYLARYGFMFEQMARERGAGAGGDEALVVTPALVQALHEALRARLPLDELPARTSWRDERMAALRALREQLR
jgi:L-gulonate 3-dehydrogenase